MAQKKPLSFLDKVARSLGYIKQVSFSTLGSFNLPAFSFYKTEDYLKAFTGWVYACVSVRSEEAAQINLRLYKVKDRKTGETEEIFEHEVLSLLQKVNPWMTMQELFEYTQAYKDLAGEAFWYLVRTGNKITQIWILRPDWVKVKAHEQDFILGYEYTVPGSVPIPMKVEEVIHFRTFNPTDPYRGLSVIRAAALTIDTDEYAERYNRKFFINSALPSVVVETEQKLDDETVKRFQEAWYDRYGGTDKAHMPAILEAGLTAKPFSLSQKDMEFLEGQRFTRDKILAIFKVPKTVLGMTEEVTVSNAEATDYVFSKRVVRPLMQKLVNALNEFLLPKYESKEELFFDFDDPVPENRAVKLETYKTLFATGALTPNEIRAQENLPEVEGLDSYYLPLGLSPIDMLGVDGEEDTPAKGARLQRKVRIPHKSMRRKLTDDIADAVKNKIVAAITKEMASGKSKTKTQLEKSTIPDDKKEAYWKEFVGKSVNYEGRYKKLAREIFERQEKDVLDRLENETKSLTAQQARRVLFSLETENKVAAGVLIPVLKEFMEEAGNDALDLLGLTDEVFDTTTANMQAFYRTDALKGIKSMNKTTKNKLRKQLGEAIANGEGIPDITRRIKEVFAEAGTMRAERIARTEVIKAGNRAALEAYKQSGIVAGKQWFTAVDERVCEWCSKMEGITLKLDEDFFEKGETFLGNEGGTLTLDYSSVEEPPLHANCRCTLVPIIADRRSAAFPAIKESVPAYDEKERVEEEVKKEIEKISAILS